MVELQPQTGDSGGGMSRDDFIGQVASDIQKSLPGQFEMDKIKRRITDVTPTTVVLFQELERFNLLIKRMNTSLIELGRALIGEVGMSNELDDVARSLFNGQIPSIWRKLAPDTLKNLANWMAHFRQRHAQYSEWVENGEPMVMWLSGLQIPESYLTALGKSLWLMYFGFSGFKVKPRSVESSSREMRTRSAEGQFVGG